MKSLARKKRHKRIAKKIVGTKERPRLVVFRSKKHIYAQLINDNEGRVICGFSTLNKEFRQQNPKGNDKEASEKLGVIFAKKLIEQKITKISFDRGGYPYHGRIKALAEGFRKGGLKF